MSNQMWKKLGFRESPYDTKPLNVTKDDVDLLLGRDTEQIDFLTSIESDSQGIFIISGVPGVGKTSFLNVQQFLLESGQADFGPRLLASRVLCPIQPSDEPKHIAVRCIQTYCKSIKEYCAITQSDVPSETKKVDAWVHQNKPATLNLGFSVLGNGLNGGRELHLPSINETTYETLVEIIGTIANEVKSELKLEGSIIVFDNMENLHVDDLNDCLTTFRDTLFTIPNIWWVLIGQSGLSSLIQSTTPKVFQRLSGSLELKPIDVIDLIKAVDIRVDRFHTASGGSSPITKETYLKLFESSNGEIRFVFKYCHATCINFIGTIRKLILEKGLRLNEKVFDKFMGEHLVNNQISDSFANTCLKNIIVDEFNGYHLSHDEKKVLKKIGEMNTVRPKDFVHFKEYGVKTMQKFTNSFLVKLADQNLLLRRQEGKSLTYELRGISVFALEYGLLNGA
ncbi:hypothetical protein Q2T41_06220 [Maribacter confluentis]|uniref:ATP-binding protein n=1 Tax=Maribacter confluentis TaxID=1656093 RepID=A0ABT8RP56_9FLAO|nr:hypothetical protein [Maribacter confluentis]MDO1512247.1 hypothetical protein [Maribacter confluentis]